MTRRFHFPALTGALCLLLSWTAATAGAGTAVGALQLSDPWIRAAPPGAMMLAGYVELRNTGELPIRIVSARSTAFKFTEIHQTVEVDGVARMREVPAVDLPPGGQVALQPGGMHLMLMRPQQPIEPGSIIAIELITAEGQAVRGDFVVRRSAD